jgi:hypothetical protein
VQWPRVESEQHPSCAGTSGGGVFLELWVAVVKAIVPQKNSTKYNLKQLKKSIKQD